MGDGWPTGPFLPALRFPFRTWGRGGRGQITGHYENKSRQDVKTYIMTNNQSSLESKSKQKKKERVHKGVTIILIYSNIFWYEYSFVSYLHHFLIQIYSDIHLYCFLYEYFRIFVHIICVVCLQVLWMNYISYIYYISWILMYWLIKFQGEGSGEGDVRVDDRWVGFLHTNLF